MPCSSRHAQASHCCVHAPAARQPGPSCHASSSLSTCDTPAPRRAAPAASPHYALHPAPRRATPRHVPTSLQSCSPAMSSRRSCRQRCYRLSYKLSTVCVDAELLHHTPSPLLSLPSAPIKERGRAELRPSPKLASPLRSACCSSSQSSLPSTHETKPRPSTLSLSHSAPR